MEVWYFNLIQLNARCINWNLQYTYVFGFPSWSFYIKFPKVMFSHFDSLGVLLNAESCFLNKFGCRYSYESLSSVPQKPHYFTERYLDVKKVLVETFYGPPKEGVYSPSVQNTLYLMAKSVLNRSLSLSLFVAHAHTNPCPPTCRPMPVSTSMLIYLHPTRAHAQSETHTHARCVCWH